MAKPVKEFSLEDLMVREATLSDDPVEKNIIMHLQRLRHHNKRLKDHIEKTSAWSSMKDVELWKPFDFYHYFCSKYSERYGSEYPQTGYIVLTYQKIDEFRMVNRISKKEYKKFIDLAFEKYFNKVNLPRVGSVCSLRLYNYIMDDNKFTSSAEFKDLDQDLVREQERFDHYVQKFNN